MNWRGASLLPAIVALAFGAIATAPSASAVGGSVVDNGDGSITATGLAITTDVLWICPSSTPVADCNVTTYVYGTITDGTYTAGSIMNTPSGTAPIPDGVYTMAVGPTAGARIMGLSAVIIGTGGGSGSTPPPILQQFGKPASGTCDEMAPTALNWANVVSGGWGDSWAQWLNDGKGGAVCTRTLVYSSASSKWTIG